MKIYNFSLTVTHIQPLKRIFKDNHCLRTVIIKSINLSKAAKSVFSRFFNIKNLKVMIFTIWSDIVTNWETGPRCEPDTGGQTEDKGQFNDKTGLRRVQEM